MKFIHMADMHFDAPFVSLANNELFAQERRLEQRTVMRKVVEYIKENNIPYFFIAGDLYEQEYIRKTTIEYINNLFKTIENTQIFISPGNHDPYINNSFYKQYEWNKNVHIFGSKLEIVEDENIDIYGYGFNDFYMKNNQEKIQIKNPEKINILITHGTLDGGTSDGRDYNPMASRDLKLLGFDYIALGHIHKKSYNDYAGQKIVYPGSTISLGFDELGERGIIEGKITKESNNIIKFIPIKSKNFEEKEFDISEINSKEEAIEKINDVVLNEDFYKIILVGKRNFEIQTDEILKLLENKNIIKIKDNTEAKYNINEIAEEISLKGIFARKIKEALDEIELNDMKKQRDSEEQNSQLKQEKNDLMKAFEIGMNVLNK